MSLLPSNSQFPNISWIDVETTGIKVKDGSKLLEVACLVTDTNLNILDEAGYTAVIAYSPEEVSDMYKATVPFVQDMHTQTNLWSRITTQGKPVSQVDLELQEYLAQFTKPQESHLGGNSITLDRNFLEAFLPESFNHIRYQSVDVSSIAAVANWWYGEKFTKKYTHSALADIKESIAELQYLRGKVFK